MNFYDVILAGKLQDVTYPANFFDLLFARKLYPADVWEIYEGTLPATFNANGDDMRQYQIFGNTGGVGDKTANLFNKNATDTSNGFIDNKYIRQTDGNYIESNSYNISEYIPVTSNTTYTWIFSLTSSQALHSNPTVEFYDSLRQSLGIANHNPNITRFSFTTPQNCAFIRASVYKQTRGESLLVEGSTAPAGYIPYGYEIDIGVKSGNLLSFDALINAPSGKLSNYTFSHVLNLTLKPNTTYTAVSDGAGSESGASDSNRSVYINDSATQNCVFSEHPVTVQTDTNGVINIGIQSERQNAQQYINGTAHVWLVEGSDVLPYQPYSNTITPIYIGSDPLEKDEYVDYQAQKIYRMIDGTLTPTDPPVALPALPTCKGTTIVDYAGSGTAPEKVVFEYKKGGN